MMYSVFQIHTKRAWKRIHISDGTRNTTLSMQHPQYVINTHNTINTHNHNQHPQHPQPTASQPTAPCNRGSPKKATPYFSQHWGPAIQNTIPPHHENPCVGETTMMLMVVAMHACVDVVWCVCEGDVMWCGCVYSECSVVVCGCDMVAVCVCVRVCVREMCCSVGVCTVCKHCTCDVFNFLH